MGTYVNNHTPIEIKCFCGNISRSRPSNISRGDGWCRKCAHNDPESSKLRLYDIVERNGSVITGTYVNNHTPIGIKCFCGNLCRSRPQSILAGNGWCLPCSGKDREMAKKRLYDIVENKGGSCIIGEYVNSRTRIDIICSCGNNCRTMPDSILAGNGWCRVCAGNCPDRAKKRIYDILEQKHFTRISNYTNSKTRIRAVCPKGHECNILPGTLLYGNGCTKCLMCPSCGLFRSKGKLCSFCKPKNENKHYEKTKEMRVVRYLREKFPDQEFIHNKSVGTQCTESHLFPDVLFDMGFYNIIIEVDEHKHRGSSYKCEKQRMHDIIAKLGMQCIFIRYNPDSKSSDMDILVETITTHMSYTLEDHNLPCDDFGFFCEYLFY